LITEQDLKSAIAECQGERNPNANTCIKLAAYLTILESLYPKEDKPIPTSQKTLETADNDYFVGDMGASDFYNAIQGKNTAEVLAVINELMETVNVINPRLYDGVLNQLNRLGMA
jgi:hypothetical protein